MFDDSREFTLTFSYKGTKPLTKDILIEYILDFIQADHLDERLESITTALSSGRLWGYTSHGVLASESGIKYSYKNPLKYVDGAIREAK